MINKLFIVGLLLITTVVHAEKPAGFLWYNVPKEEKHQKKGTPFSQLSYTDKDAVLHFYTMEALHKVRFTHQLEDERVFLALQNYWLKEASIHGTLNQKALLYYPEYDFSVTHPTSDLGAKIYDSTLLSRQKEDVSKLSKTHGLLFFYRGKEALDTKQIPILQDFCQKFKFHLIPVSVDGEKSDSLSDTRMDNGQASRLGVNYFPAIVLVNPKSTSYIPVAFGLTTQDMLIQRLSFVVHQFRGEST